LHANRPALADVPAVYFVSPTAENVRRIGADLAAGLYSAFHLSFVEPLPRALLEELAAAAARDGSEELVAQVLDQHLSFIAPAPALFSLLPAPAAPVAADAAAAPAAPAAPRSSYALLNSPRSAEDDIEAEIERIAAGLFSAVATAGHVPYIRAPRGNAAEMVAKRLEAKIRDALVSAARGHAPAAATLFAPDATGLASLQRPRASPFAPVPTRLIHVRVVLLILDRNVDLVSMLSHGWTYQALVADCLGLRLNRVTVPAADGGKPKAYDLDANDFFWAKNAPQPFPQVAEDIDVELNRYKTDAAEITRSTGVSDVNDIAQM
jgi:hypothetical protein